MHHPLSEYAAAIVREIQGLRALGSNAYEWLKSNHSSATKQDVLDAEARIIAAVRTDKKDAAEIVRLTGKLDKSSGALSESVEKNQP